MLESFELVSHRKVVNKCVSSVFERESTQTTMFLKPKVIINHISRACCICMYRLAKELNTLQYHRRYCTRVKLRKYDIF